MNSSDSNSYCLMLNSGANSRLVFVNKNTFLVLSNVADVSTNRGDQAGIVAMDRAESASLKRCRPRAFSSSSNTASTSRPTKTISVSLPSNSTTLENKRGPSSSCTTTTL